MNAEVLCQNISNQKFKLHRHFVLGLFDCVFLSSKLVCHSSFTDRAALTPEGGVFQTVTSVAQKSKLCTWVCGWVMVSVHNRGNLKEMDMGHCPLLQDTLL